MTSLQKLKLQIDALPEGQRYKLVDYMLRQEGDLSEAEAEKAWAKEIQKRVQLADQGKGRTYSVEEVLKMAKKKRL
jgi:membrane peptidoglycan carboxypeptidase